MHVDNYVAWCRYTGTTIVTCDSDDDGAFRVYRHAEQWTDPTPLTLDVLRAELGEPTHAFGDGKMWQAESFWVAIEGQWLTAVASGRHDDDTNGATLMAFVLTLGQLRRVLSVIRETETRSEA